MSGAILTLNLTRTRLAAQDRTVNHLVHNVLPSAIDYGAAEDVLTRAYAADATPTAWEPDARRAKRQAANLAIAIEGLADRCSRELGHRANPGVR